MSHQPILPVFVETMTLKQISHALIEIADNCHEWRDELHNLAWTLKDREEHKGELLKQIEDCKRRERSHEDEVRILNRDIDYLNRQLRDTRAAQ